MQNKRFLPEYPIKVKYFHYICTTNRISMENLNRLKIVLFEKNRTSKWLATQLGVNPSTVSKWCTNSSQPDLNCLLKIADILEVDIRELITREYKPFLLSQQNEDASNI